MREDKVLVISGGARGIGMATTELFLDNGYRVVNVSRSASPIAGVVQISADLSRPGWTEEAGDAVRAALGNPAKIVLIHNAAVLRKDRVQDVGADSLTGVLQTNVVAPLQLNQLVLPYMQTGSSILYVGSTLSEKAVAGSCSYVTSKHALVGLMRSTSQDLAGSGIHTACICPGFTDTEMLRAHVGENAEILQSVAAGVAYNRLVEPGEIADLLLFCAANAVINGAVLHANLGQLER